MKPTPEILIIEKHSRALRWMHWVNFPILAFMIWSGLMIYWANPAYISLPESLATKFNISGRLADGMAWHFLMMWFFTFNGILYVSYLLFSGEWRTLWPGRFAIRDAIRVTLHELHISKNAPPHSGKFNAAQRIAYSMIILMGAGSVLTGLSIYKPVQLQVLTQLLGGYEAARLEHFLLTVGFVLFFLIHVTEVIRAGWNNFRSMITGYEIKKL